MMRKARRDFLRKSVYAACATPVIMSLLVEKARCRPVLESRAWNPPRESVRPSDDDRNRGGQGGPTPGGGIPRIH